MTDKQILGAFVSCGAYKVRPDVAHFAGCYAMIFGLVGVPCRLVEFGVGKGGSLRAWRALFPECSVLGFDDDRNMPANLGPGITTYRGDQTDPETLAQIRGGPVDIIIDDCSHDFRLTMKTLAFCWPLVRPGGAYVIEDLPAAVWWDSYNNQDEYREWCGWLAELSAQQNRHAWSENARCKWTPTPCPHWAPVAALVLEWKGMLVLIKGEDDDRTTQA